MCIGQTIMKMLRIKQQIPQNRLRYKLFHQVKMWLLVEKKSLNNNYIYIRFNQTESNVTLSDSLYKHFIIFKNLSLHKVAIYYFMKRHFCCIFFMTIFPEFLPKILEVGRHLIYFYFLQCNSDMEIS